MKAKKIVAYIVLLILVLPFIVAFWAIVNSVLGIFIIHSSRVSAFVTGVFIIFIIVKTKSSKNKNKLREQIAAGRRHTDFMTNRTEAVNCDRYEQSSCNAVPAGFMEDSLNGVIWRWQPRRRKVEILGAYCSKCKAALTAVKVAESWQADLKCPACGKTFVSMSNYELSGKMRTFTQTKKLVAKVIGDRHAGHLL